MISEEMKLYIWIALVVINIYIIIKHEWEEAGK